MTGLIISILAIKMTTLFSLQRQFSFGTPKLNWRNYERRGSEVPVVGALRCCNTREEVEDVFKRFDIQGDEAWYNNLVRAMHSPVMFFSCDSPDWNLKMELAMELFLVMGWKTSALLKSIGGDK